MSTILRVSEKNCYPCGDDTNGYCGCQHQCVIKNASGNIEVVLMNYEEIYIKLRDNSPLHIRKLFKDNASVEISNINIPCTGLQLKIHDQ
jgi:hypothetical protein